MKTITWGIIGCGDVAEIKSGPAFQNLSNSRLYGVMRRNADKAKDFATRHKAPLWTTDANELIHHPEIDALYIATPPASHITYTIAALAAGKHVYLEKPMALTSLEAQRICDAVKRSKGKLTVAHYRRRLPAFLKVKDLLTTQAIGTILHVDLQILQPKTTQMIAQTAEHWRLDPEISGGGYFYDIAPHQIDLMYYFLGGIHKTHGFASSDSKDPLVETIVNGIMEFDNAVQFRGIWNFNADAANTTDSCVIYGTTGSIAFSFYGDTVILTQGEKETAFSFNNPKHIQEPMIANTVAYFLDQGNNPCAAEEGLLVMKALEKLSGRTP